MRARPRRTPPSPRTPHATTRCAAARRRATSLAPVVSRARSRSRMIPDRPACSPSSVVVSVARPPGFRLPRVLTSAANISDGTPPAETAGKDLLWFIAEGTAGTVGEEFFQCLVKHMAVAFGADVAFVAEVVPDDHERARFLACWEG